MTIEFLCPNGHQLTAGADRAGKPGKCPKCGSKFVVPKPDEDEAPAGPDFAQREETIAFLCPNGHELTGPARLQGRAGQCPHCGEKFRIPVYDDSEEEEAAEESAVADAVEPRVPSVPPQLPDFFVKKRTEDEIPVGTIVADSNASPAANDVEFPTDALEALEDSAVAPPATSPSEVIVVKPPPLFQHSLARSFFQLWNSREDEHPVEIQLRDGESIRPMEFSAELSQEEHAVFAVQDEDDSFALITVPWDEVVRIRLRKWKQIPKGLFE